MIETLTASSKAQDSCGFCSFEPSADNPSSNRSIDNPTPFNQHSKKASSPASASATAISGSCVEALLVSLLSTRHLWLTGECMEALPDREFKTRKLFA
ncbi:hypothetical protein Y032_0586g336 [Ancylostoma ceylanicum]|uniref:Uncharacterized protein n=1 Tax=Ancylostoma ceylanicum TaxID=53326 RepID=A0A016WPQ2_9BILA|nr:hypothetical protein Y032_0586g336 [Ancylostoma ceylanicum]